MTRKRNTENDVVVSPAATAAVRRKAQPRTHAHAPATERETGVAPSVETPTADQPLYEQIALLAYSYWEQRGCQSGTPEEDWLRAEEELRMRTASAAA